MSPLTRAGARPTRLLVARTGPARVKTSRAMSGAVVWFACSLALWSAAGALAGAQEEFAPPACAQPIRAAKVLRAAQPTTLPEQIRYGIGGTVRVAVALGADGGVRAADATSSSLRLFVAPALAVVRATQFAPELNKCTPVAGRFLYDVEYALPDAIPPQRVDPVIYLPGVWRCAAADSPARTLVFVRSGKGLVESDGAATMTLELDRYRIWRLRGNGWAGWAFPWVDDTWSLSTHLAKDQPARLRRIDDTTLELNAQRCTRVATAP
jgi:Gram-negative bacterial TonB protein C-terminal